MPAVPTRTGKALLANADRRDSHCLAQRGLWRPPAVRAKSPMAELPQAKGTADGAAQRARKRRKRHPYTGAAWRRLPLARILPRLAG